MSKPERRCGRMSYQLAAKPIRWSMKSAAGNISSSWPAGITSWAPRPEITSSLTRFRNTEASSYREQQHRLHVRYGQKRTLLTTPFHVCFAPQSGHLSVLAVADL